MIYRAGLPGLLQRMKDRPRKQLVIAGVVVIGLLLLGGYAVQLSGSGAGEGVPADGLEEGAVAAPVPGDVGYVDPLALEERVVEQVAATLAAMEPTVTPEPTPDIAATVQARLSSGREGMSPVVTPDVLGNDVVRNPYLRRADVAYLEDLGNELWWAVVVYLRLAEVSGKDFNDLSWTFVEERVSEVDGVFTGGVEEWLGERRGGDGREGVEPAVEEYGQLIWEGMGGLRDGGLALREMHDAFVESGVEYVVEMSAEERAEVQGLYLFIGTKLKVFDETMSRYGCSVCGELYRFEGRE